MWVEKFKSPTVTRTNRVGRIVTRTKRGWTKRQGTWNFTCELSVAAKNLNKAYLISNHVLTNFCTIVHLSHLNLFCSVLFRDIFCLVMLCCLCSLSSVFTLVGSLKLSEFSLVDKTSFTADHINSKGSLTI